MMMSILISGPHQLGIDIDVYLRPLVMMSIVILGPHQLGIDIDVYLRPLVDDLKILWLEGTTGTIGNPSDFVACCSA
jgi:hypothetical protein